MQCLTVHNSITTRYYNRISLSKSAGAPLLFTFFLPSAFARAEQHLNDAYTERKKSPYCWIQLHFVWHKYVKYTTYRRKKNVLETEMDRFIVIMRCIVVLRNGSLIAEGYWFDRKCRHVYFGWSRNGRTRADGHTFRFNFRYSSLLVTLTDERRKVNQLKIRPI